MNNKQILNEAIGKAIKNGWQEGEAHRNLVYLYPRMMGKKYIISCYYKSIIFSHDFAKAFWGGERVCTNCGSSDIRDYIEEGSYCKNIACCMSAIIVRPMWQYHLQQIVLEKEPLKYLEKFLGARK